MKILRSKGVSYTEAQSAGDDDHAASLRRGLRKAAGHGAHRVGGDKIIDPSRLPEFLGKEDFDLIQRQIIAVLDKTIRKTPRDGGRRRRGLRGLQLEAYVDRTRVGALLWARFDAEFGAAARDSEDGEGLYSFLERSWWAKVHPYAEAQCDPARPRSDDNGRFLTRIAHETPDRSQFEGRWHKAFWETDQRGNPAYEKIADKIWSHLFEQELTIGGEDPKRGQTRVPTGRGLIKARGGLIAGSANDPRAPRPNRAFQGWSEVEEKQYFKVEDVAVEIWRKLKRSRGANEPINAAWFGRALSDHYGRLKPIQESLEDDGKIRLGKLHEAVRRHYQKLARSERFRRALRDYHAHESAPEDFAKTKLGQIAPRDRRVLLDRLKGRRRNNEVSRLIRLGKLVVHASESVPLEAEDLQRAFAERMNYFATSDGQSDIKRREVFARVWRTSVALAGRTLKAWTDPMHMAAVDGKGSRPVDEDLASSEVSKKAVESLKQAAFSTHFAEHAKLIFGTKKIGDAPEGGRTALLIGDGAGDAHPRYRRIMWAMLRLAAEIRNVTGHFTIGRRLVASITGGLLEGVEGETEKKDQVSNDALDAFQRLLTSDIAAERQMLRDELEQLQVGDFLRENEVRTLAPELAAPEDDLTVLAPRFIAVMRRGKGLASADKVADAALACYGQIELDGLSKVTQGPNHCKIGLLRLLYARGFRTWLVGENGRAAFKPSIEAAVAAKKRRTKDAKEEQHLFYKDVALHVERLPQDAFEDLSAFLNRLQSRAMSEERFKRPYGADKGVQKDRSNWIEELKQALFAHLFASYLRDASLDWIWARNAKPSDAAPARTAAALDAEMKSLASRGGVLGDQPWHRQFYAWLYLVPTDQIALLRHQLIKTMVLEGKAGDGADGAASSDRAALVAMNALMRLYLAVQGAGFQGDEHQLYLKANAANVKRYFLARRQKERSFGAIFYDDPSQFDRVYDEAMESHHQSFPGTRRGLRQIFRFGHLGVLQEVFRKHRVSTAEVEYLIAGKNLGDWGDATKERNGRREEIIQAIECADKETDKKQKRKHDAPIRQACAAYQEASVVLNRNNAAANGARLTDHANLHHLMMRVVGRLLDFTLTWERDRHYLYLGMLYDQQGGLTLGVSETGDNRFKKARPKIGRGATRLLYVEGAKDGAPPHALPLWTDHGGVCLLGVGAKESGLLREDNRTLFTRYFFEVDEENPKDRKSREAAEKAKETTRKGSYRYKEGKTRIRNDLAHFNVIAMHTELGLRWNLTYPMNAVRSLMSYDRKLKNAVSKAVADILFRDGLLISWRMKDDRLSQPCVLPRVTPHLDFVRPAALRDEVAFDLPQRSMRYTSMVQALFAFGNDGYSQDAGDGARLLSWPGALAAHYEATGRGGQHRIPREILKDRGAIDPAASGPSERGSRRP